MNNDDTQRIPPQGDNGKDEVGSLLAAASDFARGVLESVQALAGTTSCKGVQIARLKDWAIAHHCWVEDVDTLGTFSDRGSENEVYASYDSTLVYKLNDFRYSDDNLTPFFERMKVHNSLFPDCAYTLLGFAENRDGQVCALLSQPFIVSEREATQQDIDDELERIGFHKEMDYFTNGDYDIFDAVPNNVLMGSDGHLYFIDTIIFASGTGGQDTYQSYSPRAK